MSRLWNASSESTLDDDFSSSDLSAHPRRRPRRRPIIDAVHARRRADVARPVCAHSVDVISAPRCRKCLDSPKTSALRTRAADTESLFHSIVPERPHPRIEHDAALNRASAAPPPPPSERVAYRGHAAELNDRRNLFGFSFISVIRSSAYLQSSTRQRKC